MKKINAKKTIFKILLRQKNLVILKMKKVDFRYPEKSIEVLVKFSKTYFLKI